MRLSVLRSAGSGRDSAPLAGVRIDVADPVGTPVDSWEMARALPDAPGTDSAQAFAEAVSDSLDQELEFRQGVYVLLRLAHAIVRTQDPGTAPSPDPGEQAADTSPWTRTLHEPVSGGNLVPAFVGDGVSECPVWLCRAADGRVAALVVDTLTVDRPTNA